MYAFALLHRFCSSRDFICIWSVLIYQTHNVLYLFFWIQLALQSEAFAWIALSHVLKNRIHTSTKSAITSLDSSSLLVHNNVSTKVKDRFISILAVVAILIPLTVTMSALLVHPFFNYAELPDLSFVMRIFDMIILGYIFKATIANLVKAANLKLLYIPVWLAHPNESCDTTFCHGPKWMWWFLYVIFCHA